MFLIDVAVGGGLVLAGEATWAIIWGTRKPKPPKPIEAICGCKHHYSMHDPKTGECHAQEQFMVSKGDPILDSYGDEIIGHKGARFEVHQCGCRRYTGPEPLPSYYAPELTP